MATPNFEWDCAHCAQRCGNYEGGYGAIIDKEGKLRASCHPTAPARPDCYRRVTVYNEPVGALIGADPMPAGIEDLRPPEPGETAGPPQV